MMLLPNASTIMITIIIEQRETDRQRDRDRKMKRVNAVSLGQPLRADQGILSQICFLLFAFPLALVHPSL